MPTTIKLKNSVTTTSVPSSLVQGEVAINITDKKVWVGNAATTPIQLLGGGADGNFTNISVSSVATFGAGTVSAPSITTTGDTNTGIFFPAADTIAFTEGGVESMRIDSSGNVGIGTSSPATKLDVQGLVAGNFFQNLYNDSSDASAQTLYVAKSFGASGIQFGQQKSTANGIINLIDAAALTFGTANTERMRIDSSGNVGIGRTSPTARLHLSTASGTTALTLSTNSNDNANATIYNDATFLGIGSNFGATGVKVKIALQTPDNAMTLDSSGILLLGTTGLGNNGTRMSVSGSNRVVRILGSTEGEGAFMVDKTTNTSTTSQVFIQFSINNQATANGQINANGASQAAFGSFSDSRLKENIEDLPPQLVNICALRPVEFDYIESEGGGHQIGFVAQEIQEVYPDVVGERTDGMLTVTGWSKTEARLVKAIQEQQSLIENLTTRLNALEGK